MLHFQTVLIDIFTTVFHNELAERRSKKINLGWLRLGGGDVPNPDG